MKFPAFGWDGDSLGAVFSTFGHHVGGFVLLSVAVAGPAAALMALDSWLYATKRRVEALHNERLFEQEGLFRLLKSSDSFEEHEDCRVAQELLKTLLLLLRRHARMLRKGTLGDHARAELGQRGTHVSHLMAKQQLPVALAEVGVARARLELRLSEVRFSARARDFQEGHVYCCWRSAEARRRELELRARIGLALVPSRLRDVEYSHHRVRARLDGGVFNCDSSAAAAAAAASQLGVDGGGGGKKNVPRNSSNLLPDDARGACSRAPSAMLPLRCGGGRTACAASAAGSA